jgi:CheY-like chemotaxis protein
VERLHDVRVVAEALGQCGVQVIAAESALEALTMFKRERPDVVVSGLSMPDKDGYWLASRRRW